jgi:LysR family cys regulon transcriptional activator
MNFQQLKSVREAVRCGFNLTEVANMLFTSQPGVSRQIRELEDELGIEIFVRNGKRLTGLTPPGQALLPLVEQILLGAENIKRVGDDFSAKLNGQLSVAATHSQARYALPHVVRDFRQLFPNVSLHLHQGSPKQVAEMLLSGEADIGVATEALAQYPQLVALPCYRWTHSIVVPPDHPLLAHSGPVTLAQLAQFPIITYEHGYTGRSHIDDAFAKEGLSPDVVLTAMDADTHLRLLDAGHLFEINQTRLAIWRGAWLRGFAYSFIETFAPTLTREAVEQALAAN